MARPFKQGLSYFPHDTDAHHDDKLQSLMALYGTEGYTFYFILLEKIFRMENGRITCGNLAEKAGLSKTIGITIEKFDAILATALEIGCFNAELYQNEKILTSNGIEKRIISVNNLRLKDRERKDKDKRKRKRKAKTGKPMENSWKTPNPSSRTPISDEDFIKALKDNPAYKGIDIDKELAKMDAWFLTPKGIGRKKTHKFILNWINKADKEVTTGSQGYQKLSPVEQRLKELENERKNLS